ncbi:MAG: hypothetical protein IPJ19_02630 [Planctomycetes bacterium]|nr:hypothetical protein [Planctomycetota bacterium]
MAWLGRESGIFELWMWPLRLARGIELFAEGQALAPLSVEVRPERVEFSGVQGTRVWSARFFAARAERAAFVEFELAEGPAAIVELRCTPDFTPQWPAGLGGRIAACDPETGALVLTEELGRFAALIGARSMLPLELDADHSLGAGPVVIRVPLEPGGKALFTIAGAELDPGPLSEAARLGEGDAACGFARAEEAVRAARALWLRAAAQSAAFAREQEAHWRSFLSRTTLLEGPRLWAKIAIERAWVEVDGLGRGLVAGLREAGATERPGFGWFFDGDAMTAARAMCAYGDFEGAKEVLRFAARHQRADGKLMHELVLSSRLCDWLGEYPYAYYKAGNTPAFLAVLEHVVRTSGDAELARELLPAAERALGFCECCLDARGLISNRKAGIAAVEAGVLVGRIETEILLSGIWISGLRGLLALARSNGRTELAARAETLLRNAERGFESFWSEKEQRYGFAHLIDGTRCDDLTAYTAHPLSRGIGDPERARKTARQLNRHELATGWGARMFSSRSSVYDPANYNTGSVFPYLAGFNILALFEHGQPLAAQQQLRELVALDGFSGLGFVPEHLLGDRREEPARGVPHQIFSSAALIQACARAARERAPEPWAEFHAPLRILWSEKLGSHVLWRVAGPAGAQAELDFRCDRACTITGAVRRGSRLEIRLPAGPPDTIVEHMIEFHPSEGAQA